MIIPLLDHPDNFRHSKIIFAIWRRDIRHKRLDCRHEEFDIRHKRFDIRHKKTIIAIAKGMTPTLIEF